MAGRAEKTLAEGLAAMGMEFPEVPLYIKHNLSPRFQIREYQEEAFQYSIYYIEHMAGGRQIHLLYHMATGSGKTYIMAGMILYYYKHGYRNFLFFVDQKPIVEKTKENFINKAFGKYLFPEKTVIDGKTVEMKTVENFQDCDKEAVNIKFTTVQQLHEDLNRVRENSTTIQDYEAIKTVFIADEAHHLNAGTKKSKEEKKTEESWENSVDRIFKSNKENVMLEFTATCDLKNENIYEKYRDKIIYDYPLLKYREEGYTKEFLNLQSAFGPLERTIQAMLLSQYRLKLFELHGRRVKPVILLKSRTVAESREFFQMFADYMADSFGPEDIEKIRRNAAGIVKRMFGFFKEREISDQDLAAELRQAFSAEHLIFIDSRDKNLSEKQKKVNDLENPYNPYRMIFTVDMLSEGWDVLNLFDIVRLYDTRQRGTNISKTTIQEAQLIGRGVRYCPFKLEESQDAFKRKYDEEPENEMRVCETLYYHSRQDSGYIRELRQALKEIGFEPKEAVKFTTGVKERVKNKDSHKKGRVFEDKQIKVNLSSSTKDFSEAEERVIKVSEYAAGHYPVVYKALRQYPVFRFNRLSGYYPYLTGIKEFITSEKYAGQFRLHIVTDGPPTNLDYYEAFLYFFGELAEKIQSG